MDQKDDGGPGGQQWTRGTIVDQEDDGGPGSFCFCKPVLNTRGVMELHQRWC